MRRQGLRKFERLTKVRRFNKADFKRLSLAINCWVDHKGLQPFAFLKIILFLVFRISDGPPGRVH
jgi:hypothetical protein